MKAVDCLGWVSWVTNCHPSVIANLNVNTGPQQTAMFHNSSDKTLDLQDGCLCLVFQVDGTILARLLIYVRMSQSRLVPAVRLRSSLKLIFSKDIGSAPVRSDTW